MRKRRGKKITYMGALFSFHGWLIGHPGRKIMSHMLMGCQRSMACSHQYPAAPKGFAPDAPTGSHIIEAMGAFSEHHTLHTCFSKAFFPLETLWHATTANTPWPAITAAEQAKLFAGHHAAPAPISYPASFWDCF